MSWWEASAGEQVPVQPTSDVSACGWQLWEGAAGCRDDGSWLLSWLARCAGRWHEFVHVLCMLARVLSDCFSHSPSEAHFRPPLGLLKAREITCCASFWLTRIPLSPAWRALQDPNI